MFNLKNRKMSKWMGVSLGSVLIISLLLNVCSVSASWSEDEVYGTWTGDSTHAYWNSTDDGTTSWRVYSQTVNSFERWSFGKENLDQGVYGWWFSSSVSDRVIATVQGGSWEFKAYLEHRSIYMLSEHTIISLDVNGYAYDSYAVQGNDKYIVAYFWRSTDYLVVTLMIKESQNSTEYLYKMQHEFNVGSSWFDSVTLTQEVRKDMGGAYPSGWICGEKIDEELLTGGGGGTPYNETAPENLAGSIAKAISDMFSSLAQNIYELLPEGVRGFVDNIGDITVGAGSLFTSLFGLVTNNWEQMEIILVLAFLSMVFYLIETGDVSGFVQKFVAIAHFAVSVANLVLAVIRTIVNLIKWW